MANNLLYQVDYLIEQTQIYNQNSGKKPSAPTLIGQNIAASMVPAIAVSSMLSNPIKDSLVSHGVSSSNIAGIPNLSHADIGTSAATSLIGMAASGVGSTLMKKFQEKKYGMMQAPDNRTTAQKATDTTLNTASRLVGLGTSIATRVGLAATLGPAAATGLASVPATMAANMITSKPLNMIRQKIQQKRMIEQQQQNQQPH